MARPRKPTHLKLVTGTTRADRANPAEPQPARRQPKPPAHLSPRAAVAWRNLAPLLERMGVLTEADGMALERLCECYADLLDARASLARPVGAVSRDGEIVNVAPAGESVYTTRGKDGFMVRARPELALIADADRRFRGYLADFGLTPAARSKVQGLGGEAEVDPLAGYFAH